VLTRVIKHIKLNRGLHLRKYALNNFLRNNEVNAGTIFIECLKLRLLILDFVITWRL